jgi:hypothetical protein
VAVLKRQRPVRNNRVNEEDCMMLLGHSGRDKWQRSFVVAVSILSLALISPENRVFARETVDNGIEPFYVVLAVDVSGSMDENDPLEVDPQGNSRTLRDDAQVVFLQLLPFLCLNPYVATVCFADDVTSYWPSTGDATLVSWRQTHLDYQAIRSLVDLTQPESRGGTRIYRVIDWAYSRIQQARKRHGDGTAVLIILTDGDPEHATAQLKQAHSPVLTAAGKLAAHGISMYPIIINKASYRRAGQARELSSKESSGQKLTELAAAKTGGKAYRITKTAGFADIFMDIFGYAGKTTTAFPVSRHYQSMVIVGPSSDSTFTAQAGVKPGVAPHAVLVVNGTDPISGIGRTVIPSTNWDTVVLTRPQSLERVRRYWSGNWRISSKTQDAGHQARVYPVPDFLLRVQAEPGFPWWVHERVRVNVQLIEKSDAPRSSTENGALFEAEDISLRLTVTAEESGESITLSAEPRGDSGHRYGTESFQLDQWGPYRLNCECRDRTAGMDILLAQFAQPLFVHPDCIHLTLLKATSDEVLLEVPPTGLEPLTVGRGGEPFYGQLNPEGRFRVCPLFGALYLEGTKEQQLDFKLNSSGELVTDLVTLPKLKRSIAGHVEAWVKTFGGVKEIRPPHFALSYRSAMPDLEFAFGDERNALWVGEFHNQQMTISVSPVFDDNVDEILQSFPEEITEIRVHAYDSAHGTSTSVKSRCRLSGSPELMEGTEGAVRIVKVAYSLRFDTPIPPSDRLEIDVKTVIPGLAGVVKRYAVVDPISQATFRWQVSQGSSEAMVGSVPDILFRDEPVQFATEWRPSQKISGVSFEILQPAPARPIPVELPIAVGAHKAQVSQLIEQLELGETYSVQVNVAVELSEKQPPTNLRLQAGRFQVQDRWPILKELAVGGLAGADIPCRALEELRLPLSAVFAGCIAESPRHKALIEEFKKSCVLTVTNEDDSTRDITDTIQWTSATFEQIPHGQSGLYGLEGHAVYRPNLVGRAEVEFNAELKDSNGCGHAYVVRKHLFATDAPFRLEVRESRPGEKSVLFDSQEWIRGQYSPSTVTTCYVTNLELTLHQVGGEGVTESRPSELMVKAIHRSAPDQKWTTTFLERAGLEPDQTAEWKIQIARPGDYAVEVIAYDSELSQPGAHLVTPTLVSVRPYEVVPVILPSAFLTGRVRQWPFEYRVPLDHDPGMSIRPDAFAFRFRMPGIEETWLDGPTGQLQQDRTGQNWLLVKNSSILPPVDGLTSGAISFRLAYQGVDRIAWEYPGVRVVAPWLEGASIGNETRESLELLSQDGLLFDAPLSLWVRPEFRSAPELEPWWKKTEVVIYVLRDPGPDLGAGVAPVQLIRALAERTMSQETEPDVDIYRLTARAGSDRVRVLQRDMPGHFWGWPKAGKRERYAVLISATYDVESDDIALSGDGRNDAAQHQVTEWSDVYLLVVNMPWIVPWFWWLLICIVLLSATVRILKLLVPSPEGLHLDVRLDEDVATVEPIRLGNPMLVDVCETPLRTELSLYGRLLRSRWNTAGRATPPLVPRTVGIRSQAMIGEVRSLVSQYATGLLGSVSVLVRRWLYPRRWAWFGITPKVGKEAENVRTELLCVWTGVKSRAGRLWSSQAGILELPRRGETRVIRVELSFTIDSVARKMLVAIRIRRGHGQVPEMPIHDG